MAKKTPTADETQSWLVPLYNAVLICDEAKRQGVDPRELIRGTGLSLKELQDSDTLKSYDQIVALIDNALRLCPQPGLGLRIGRNESPTQWGIVGYAVMCCKSLRDMLAMLIKYHRVAASMAEFYLREEADMAFLEVRPPRAIHNALATVVEEHFSSIVSAARLLTGKNDLRPVEVQLTYARPAYARMYQEVFRCPVHFNRSQNSLAFGKKWLDAPIMHSSALSSQMAERLCEMQLRRQYLDHDIVHRVRYLLLQHTGTFPDAEGVAEFLHITSRTLRNQLRDQGTSFQAILDDVRQQLAINYLEASDLSLEDISGLVGFNDVSNFRRAFVKWTGKSPSYFRPA